MPPFEQNRACCCQPQQKDSASSEKRTGISWNLRYAAAIAVVAVLWCAAYFGALPAANWLAFGVICLEPETQLGEAVSFFLYDTAKILLLLVAMIYAIGWLRASLDVERVRFFLEGRRRLVGYVLGSAFGAITPFCSCSSIPLFLGFTMARIPIGSTMAFLISSPLVNEIAVVLLWGLLGWKFTLIYVAAGILAGILGGAFMDAIRAERWLQPFIRDAVNDAPRPAPGPEGERRAPNIRQRHEFAFGETGSIFKRVWKWVFIGVGVGAALHGFVPDNWFEHNLASGQWWTVPLAVLVGIPLYSNVTGIIPVMRELLVKGMPMGTTLAFCMSSVAASIPELLMLRQIMTLRLQAAFIGYLWVLFTLMGWLFNLIGPWLR